MTIRLIITYIKLVSRREQCETKQPAACRHRDHPGPWAGQGQGLGTITRLRLLRKQFCRSNALRRGTPTQSDYVHFSMHNVVSRRLGTRPTIYVRAETLPASSKRSLRSTLFENCLPHMRGCLISMLKHQQASSTVSGPVPACVRSQIFEFQRQKPEPMGFDY